jgi:hypothetical protein
MTNGHPEILDNTQPFNTEVLEKFGLGAGDFIKILLVAHQQYPGGVLALYEQSSFDHSDPIPYVRRNYISASNLQQVLGELEKLGLKYLVSSEKQNGVTEVFYSHDSNWLKTKNPTNKDDRFWGEFLGFPQSAIEDFVSGGHDYDYVPDYIKKSKYFTLLPFKLSRLRYKEEWNDFLNKIHYIEKIHSSFVAILLDNWNEIPLSQGHKPSHLG